MRGSTWLVIGLLILLLTAYPALYLYSLNTVDAQDVQLTAVDVNLKGITFSGTVELMNQGFVQVTIDGLDYNVIFEPTGQVMSSGTINGVSLKPGMTAPTTFSNTIPLPDISTLPVLLRAEEINVVIEGKARATFLGMTISKPF